MLFVHIHQEAAVRVPLEVCYRRTLKRDVIRSGFHIHATMRRRYIYSVYERVRMREELSYSTCRNGRGAKWAGGMQIAASAARAARQDRIS